MLRVLYPFAWSLMVFFATAFLLREAIDCCFASDEQWVQRLMSRKVEYVISIVFLLYLGLGKILIADAASVSSNKALFRAYESLLLPFFVLAFALGFMPSEITNSFAWPSSYSVGIAVTLVVWLAIVFEPPWLFGKRLAQGDWYLQWIGRQRSMGLLGFLYSCHPPRVPSDVFPGLVLYHLALMFGALMLAWQ